MKYLYSVILRKGDKENVLLAFVGISGIPITWLNQLIAPLILPHARYVYIWRYHEVIARISIFVSAPFLLLALFGLYHLRDCHTDRYYRSVIAAIIFTWISAFIFGMWYFFPRQDISPDPFVMALFPFILSPMLPFLYAVSFGLSWWANGWAKNQERRDKEDARKT